MDRLDQENLENVAIRMLEGSITDAERDCLVKWLDESAENRAEFRRILSLWNIPNIEKVSRIDLYKAESKVMDRIFRKPVLRWKRILINTAAILAVPLAFTTAYLGLAKGLPQDVRTIETMVPPGARSKLVLPDSSTVHLNAGSRLIYASAFNEGIREVTLEGEGYFEVTSSESCPFIVRTDNFTVRCTGTEFNIRAYSSESEQSVTLIDGKVHVEIDDSRISMNPNERMTIAQDGTHKITSGDPYRYYAWKNGEIAFRNDRLEDVLKLLSATYNYDFVLMDDSLKKYSVHATFKNETIHEMVSLMECILPVKCRFTPSADPNSLGIVEIRKK